MIRPLVSVFLSIFLVIPSAILAAVNTDVDIPPAYQVVAAEYSIPPALLYSVALTESGNNYNGERIPWPWAVNHAGQSFYFQTRKEAYDYVSNTLDSGKRNFDLGLMQVNWRWNSHVFDSLWDALDPYTNLRGGASIIRGHYRRLGTLEAAIGAYHAPNNASRAHAYRDRVRANLSTVLYARRHF